MEFVGEEEEAADDVGFCWIEEVCEYECDEGDERDGPAVFERESCEPFPDWTMPAFVLSSN